MTADRILGCSHEFVGREGELDRVIAAAHAGADLAILAAPGAGASELLKQAYDELFRSESLVPFYFELDHSDRDALSAARRFATEFLASALAFLVGDPRILHFRPGLEEISRLAPAPDAFWVDGAIEALSSPNVDIPTLIGLPARSHRQVCVMIDGVDRVWHLREGERFLESVERLGRSNVCLVGSGLRRAIYGRLPFETVSMDHLEVVEAQGLVAAIAAERRTELPDEVRDLIAVQTGRSAAVISRLVQQAVSDGENLAGFASAERTYTNSLFGGLISRNLGDRIMRTLPRSIDQDNVVALLAETLRADGRRLPLAQWRRSLDGIDDMSFGRLIRHLHGEEIVSAGEGIVDMSATSVVIADYVAVRTQILAEPRDRAAIVGRAMRSNLARASQLMAKAYRDRSAIGVREFLGTCDGQAVAVAAVDYGLFRRNHKGQKDDAALAALRTAKDRISLPRIIYTADAAAYYPPIAEISDHNRAAVGITDSGNAWLIAEIDSKLEATAETAEFWCDRLEMAAINSRLDNYRLWLIAPEGFDDDALAILGGRSAFGSSRKQIDLLRQILGDPPAPPEAVATKYEISIPMGEEGELEVVRSFKNIADKHSIPQKAAAQIKTALVEALINAAEHSLSPDQVVHLTFAVTDDAITITLRNRGLKLTQHMLAQADLSSERRGWGLELIRKLMDSVHIEPTDDGTRLVITKRLTGTP